MILNTGDHWQPEEADVIAWQRAYKKVDVYQELLAMESWCDANVSKRKTKVGIKSFVNRWLAKAQNQGASPWVNKITTADSLRSMTLPMQASDVSWLAPEDRLRMVEFFLAKYGYYYSETTDPETHKTIGELHYGR